MEELKIELVARLMSEKTLKYTGIPIKPEDVVEIPKNSSHDSLAGRCESIYCARMDEEVCLLYHFRDGTVMIEFH